MEIERRTHEQDVFLNRAEWRAMTPQERVDLGVRLSEQAWENRRERMVSKDTSFTKQRRSLKDRLMLRH